MRFTSEPAVEELAFRTLDARLRRKRRRGGTQPSREDLRKVGDLVAEGTLVDANLAFRDLVYRFVRFLYAGKWDNSGKLGRNCTRFEREGQCRGIGESSRRLMRLIENPSNSHKRLKTAPDRVRDTQDFLARAKDDGRRHESRSLRSV